MLPSSRSRAALLAVVALVAALLVVAPVGSATAGPTDTRPVAGYLNFPGLGNRPAPNVKVLWFTKDWQYIGQKSANGGSYALNLVPGTYWLQFVDQRPSWRTDKYAVTDVQVTVTASRPAVRDVTMKRGAFVTGKVATGNGPGKKARVAVARTLPNGQNQSFDTTANGRGEFAIGGLPEGKWSLFAWDKKQRWVGKSTWVGKVRTGSGKDVRIRLGQRSGSLRVLLYKPDGSSLSGKTVVTVTSRKTGQWWSATAHGGTVVFKGVHPGKYKLKFDGTGNWLASTGAVRRAKVRANRASIGTFKVTKRGGWITGQAVDGGAPSYPMPNAQVQLYDQYGTKIDETVSAADGTFLLDGQLYTQDGMTVVVNPWPERGGFTPTTGYCHFGTATLPGVPVTQGAETALGAVSVPREPGADASPACL